MKKSKANDLALLTEHGLAVFPLQPNAKTPFGGTHGCKDAVTDLAEAREMFKRHPDANIGVATGAKSNLVVVDVDTKKSQPGFASFKTIKDELGVEIARTAKVKTVSNGSHYYYRVDAGDVRNSASAVAPGIDIRGEGGYVVVPHSTINGTGYEWIRPLDRLIDLPESLHSLIVTATAKAKRPASENLTDEIPESQRNDSLFRIGIGFRAQGMNERDIRIALLAVNKDHCNPPLDTREVTTIARSVVNGGQQTVVHELNAKLAYFKNRGQSVILSEEPDANYPGTTVVALSRVADIRVEYANQHLEIRSEDGKAAKLPKFEIWLKDPARRRVRSIVLKPQEAPGFNAENGNYNIWSGWPVKPHEEDDQHSWKLLRQHIRSVIASGNKTHSDEWHLLRPQRPEGARLSD